MALILWEPVTELNTIQNEMNRLFNTFFEQPNQGGRGNGIASGLEFLLQAIQRPGPAERAMDHQHRWLHAGRHRFASERKAAITCL